MNMHAVARQVRLDQQTELAVFKGDEANLAAHAACCCLPDRRRRHVRRGVRGNHHHAEERRQPYDSLSPAHSGPLLAVSHYLMPSQPFGPDTMQYRRF